MSYCTLDDLLKLVPVGGFTVEMASLQSRRTWPNKGFQYKSVDQAGEVFSIYSEDNREIRTAMKTKDFVRGLAQNDSRGGNSSSCGAARYLSVPIRPHTALIGNIISGEVENRFPNFFGGVKILVSHLSALLHRVFLGLEPFRRSSAVGACLFIST